MKLSSSFLILAATLIVGQVSPFVVPQQKQIGWVVNQRKTILYSSESPSRSSDTESRPRAPGPRKLGGGPNGNNNNRGPNNHRRDNRSNNYRNNNRPQGGRRPGGGNRPHQGGGQLLFNPMKLQRIQIEAPPRPDNRQQQGGRPDGGSDQGRGGGGGDNNRRGGGPPERRSPAAAASAGGGAGGVDTATAPSDGDGNAGRGRRARPEKKERNYNQPRRPSLRIGTGKRGRAAEKNSRRSSLRKKDRTAEREAKEERAMERRTVQLPDGPMSVSQLAEVLDEKPVGLIKFLMTDLGVMASMTQNLDPATCIAVAEGMGKIVAGQGDDEDDDEYDEYDDEDSDDSAVDLGYAIDEDDPEDLLPRPPVVTIMGHVDHGKTSLLDAIRNTRVTAGEAGGITQHIGAYQVEHNDQKITFIDTPGHAAFNDMRQRGANITDIVILVVAADDGVKQQTADSIMCARQAGVPLIVAVNKCDLETADPNRVKSDLTGYEVLTEDFGGEVLCSEISAKEGTNLDDLLDKVMLQSELQDLKANPDREAQGVVVEARVEKGLGTIATVLVQKGTLKIGDCFVAGETYGKVRALIQSDGKTRVDEAEPSLPISVVGFDGCPSAGDMLVVAENEQIARELAESRRRIARERESSSYQSGLMGSVAASWGADFKERREMCVVVKADVQGSAEALTQALSDLKLENDEAVVTVKVLVSEAGDVSKSDIAVASVTPGTTVLAFNCAANYAAMEDARAMNVPIEYYSIVYEAIESVESRMQEVLSPTPEGEYVGSAVVQEVFNIGGTGNIAGSKCTDGFLKKGSNVRVMRGDKILGETKVRTLRNFKAEVDSIEAGNECGIGLVDFETFEPGDVIESYVEK